MTKIHHINCGSLEPSPGARAVCHCLLLDDRNGLALVDSGFSLAETRQPAELIGQPAIDAAGLRFYEADTAMRRIEALGLRPEDVGHAVITHGDLDHAGGLADFPQAEVHISEEEHAAVTSGQTRLPRYLPRQFEHGPKWRLYGAEPQKWYGLEARPLDLGLTSEVLLIPLFGHTLGHCGVAVQQGGRWLLHVGDAYYLRVELATDDHPISDLTARNAEDDAQRRQSLEHLRRIAREHPGEVELVGYHDATELP